MGTKVSGYVLINCQDGEKKIGRREISYQHSIPITPPNFGSPITELVAQAMIQRYLKNPIPEVDEKIIALDFARNDLESILKQRQCEGIRFYLAKKCIEDFENPNDIEEGITLVAIGIKEGKIDIATVEKENIVRNLRRDQNTVDFADEPAEQDGIIFEMVPPLTHGKIRSGKELFTYGSLEEIIKNYYEL